MFFARKSRGGINLVGLLVIIGILYFSGAGSWLWSRVKQIDGACYDLLARIQITQGQPICVAVARGINTLDRQFGQGLHFSWQDKLSGLMPSWISSGGSPFGQFEQKLRDNISSLASPSDRLSQLIQAGPSSLYAGAVGDEFQASVDSYAIGQHYITDGSTALGVQWLQQGASRPGYGMFSQITLGNTYLKGGTGVKADSQQAQIYYQQAKQSLQLLQQSKSPEAQRMLQTLPSDPATITKQLDAMIEKTRNSD